MLPRKCRGVMTGSAVAQRGELCAQAAPSGHHPGLLPSRAPLSRHTLGSTEDDHVDI